MIDHHLLIEPGGNSHGNAAVHLTPGHNRVKNNTGIMDVVNFFDFHLAKRNIHRYLDKRTAECGRVAAGFVGDFGS